MTSEDYCHTIPTIQGTASDPDDDPLQYRWLEGQTVLLNSTPVGSNGEAYLDLCNVPLILGTRTLTLEVSDGKATASDEMILTIDNSAPHAAPSGGGIYQIGEPITVGGQVSDFDGDDLNYKWLEGDSAYCSGEIQSTAGGEGVDLPLCNLPALSLGTHTIRLAVSDQINEEVAKDISIMVKDSTAPSLKPEPNVTILWPPNHKMVNITINANASDDSGLPVTLSATVASNEPDDGLGDGDTAPDWTTPVIDQQTGMVTLSLRAERSGSGNGRTYTIAIIATDASGNTSTANVEIIVPHDKGK